MANGLEALTHAEKLVGTAINRQEREHRKWESTQGFDWETLENEPSRLMWWMLRQPRYMDHIYGVAVHNRGLSRNFPPALQDLVMRNYAGATNEILAYFTHAAAIKNEDEGLILIDHGNARDVIVQDALFARKRGYRYTAPIRGRIIGNYDPDALLATLYAQEDEETGYVPDSDHEIVAAFEATAVNDTSHVDPLVYQQNKVGHLDIAKIHHPHLFGSAYIQLGMPKSRSPIKEFVEEVVEPIDLPYSSVDLNELKAQVFHQYRPGNRKQTLAELMPELRNHPSLRGIPLPEKRRDSRRYRPARRPAYT
jgi:hypothetical protein